ncbi:insecticidal delta-endotoxin Cry8Ea1 family protein, partial [Lysinibacillus sp. UGB7]|uniref:insecticidal delta-endotoxin Cry8Ea1 family protein n=1 Tax=Lysinibacillus sp. UGB7 TaxID=3411039 RepID=UPI003B808903
MNQDKTTKIKILDDSSRISKRYNSHAEDSTAALQTMNYKDWLNKCEVNPGAFVYNLEGLSTALTALEDVINSLKNPIDEAYLLLHSKLYNLYYPSVGSTTIWRNLITHTEELLEKQLSETARENALFELSVIRSQLSSYISAFDFWKANPNNANAVDEVRHRFQSTHSEFVGAIPAFESYGDNTLLLLPVYAQIANLHLLLLREGVIYANQWHLSRAEGDLYHQNLLRYTEDYINHCSNWYDQGFNQFRSNGDWNRFNNYRRFMTINVLDFISLFSNYDARMYSFPTNMELTREIYSDALMDSTPQNLQNLESSLVRQPHFFTWLRGLTVSTYTATINHFLQGHSSKLSYTAGSLFDGPTFGNVLSPSFTQSLVMPENFFIYKNLTEYSIVSTGININKMVFAATNAYPIPGYYYSIPPENAETHEIIYDVPNSTTNKKQTIFDLPPRNNESTTNFSNFSHILSYMTSYNNYSGIGPNALTFAWTHTSVTPFNLILRDNTNRIVQFPAVKASSMNEACIPRKGPKFTGGDVVELKSTAHLIYNPNIAGGGNQHYRIRVRYAATASGISFYVYGADIKYAFLEKTVNGPINDTSTLKYTDFKYAYLEGVFNPSDASNRFIEVFREDEIAYPEIFNATLIIDKIEFVPINVSSAEYEGLQNVEKATKAVNDLFTNETKNMLKADTTDYEIDQVANLVECVSDDLYAKEKIMLLDEVKYAKQLSQSRNLLQNGDFENLNGNGF